MNNETSTTYNYDEKEFELGGKKLPLNISYRISEFTGINANILNKHRDINTSFSHSVEHFVNSKVNNYKNLIKEKKYNKTIRGEDQSYEDVSKLKNILLEIFSNPYNLGRFLAIQKEENEFKENFLSTSDIYRDIRKSNKYLSCVFNVLNENQFEWLLSLLKSDLSRAIKSGEDFNDFLKYMNENQRTVVYESFKNNFKRIIEYPSDFYYVLEYLNEAQRASVFESFQNNLSFELKDGSDFNFVLKNLNESQRTVFYDLCKDIIPSFLHVSKYLGDSMEYLTDSQRNDLFELCKNELSYRYERLRKLNGGITNYLTESFNDDLKYLKEAQRTEVFECAKDYLKDTIKSAKDFNQVLEYLNETQRTFVYELCKNNLEELSSGVLYFGSFIKYLNDKQIKEVCELHKKSENKNTLIFIKDFEELTEKQRTIIYESFKNNFTDIVKSAGDFHVFFKNLNDNQKMEFYNIYKENLKTIIKTGGDFNLCAINLKDNQKEEFYDLFKDNLKEIIKSAQDLFFIIKSLNESQAQAVYNLFKDNLTNIINSASDFKFAIGVLCAIDESNDESIDEFLELFKHKLKVLVKSGQDFKNILEVLIPERKKFVFELFKDDLKDIMTSAYDFGVIIKYLNETQRMKTFEVFKRIILEDKNKIKDTLTLNNVFEGVITFEKKETEGLNEIEKAEIFEIIKDNLKNIVRNSRHILEILEILNETQRIVFIESLKDNLVNFSGPILDKTCYFREFIKRLNGIEVKIICDLIKDDLKIKSWREFIGICGDLDEIERNYFCESLKDKANDFEIKDYEPSPLAFFNEKQIIILMEPIKKYLQHTLKSSEHVRSFLISLDESRFNLFKYNLFDIIKSEDDFYGATIYEAPNKKLVLNSLFLLGKVKKALANYQKREPQSSCSFTLYNSSESAVRVENIISETIGKIENNSEDIYNLIKVIKEHESSMSSDLREELSKLKCLSCDNEDLLEEAERKKTLNP